MTRKDLRPLAFLAILLLIQFAPVLFTGRSYFLGDLTYFNHPWRALPAQMLQRGILPAWNPYGYMGMPLLGIFQTGTFSPGNLPFLFFGFPAAYKMHLVLHHALAALFTYLWLRPMRSRAGATAAAATVALGGYLLTRVSQVIVVQTLCWWPALFLFAGNPVLLGLALAVSLLGGHPPIWLMMGLGAAALPWGWARGASVPRWAGAGLLAFGLCACTLLPGLEMVRRSAGFDTETRTVTSIKAADLASAVSPLLAAETDAAGAKYPLGSTFYIGFAAAAACLLGAGTLDRRRGLWLAAFLALCVLVLLGREGPGAGLAWRLPPLRYLRFPGNFSFLLLGVSAPLVCLGLRRHRWSGLFCLVIAAELLAYGRGIEPTMPDSYFVRRGPLVSWLQENLGSHRYAASPIAALLQKGFGRSQEERFLDFKDRLYADANLPYRLSAATGLGESLLFGPSLAVMDFVFRLPSQAAALPYFSWLDVRWLMSPGPAVTLPPVTDWVLEENPGAARARWIPASEAGRLAGGFEAAVSITGSEALHYSEPREDRLTVIGVAPGPGSVFIADPLFPGWELYAPLRQPQRVEPRPALAAFQQVAAPGGQVWLEGVYRPLSLWVGALLSAICAAGLAGWALLKARAV